MCTCSTEIGQISWSCWWPGIYKTSKSNKVTRKNSNEVAKRSGQFSFSALFIKSKCASVTVHTKPIGSRVAPLQHSFYGAAHLASNAVHPKNSWHIRWTTRYQLVQYTCAICLYWPENSKYKINPHVIKYIISN